MKKHILIAFFIFTNLIVFAQLDEYSVMGIPIGTTSQINSVTPLEEGALVYNTDTKKLMIHNGTTWVSVSGTNWSLTGNSTITSGTNFIGTTDAQDLVFKTNNTEALRINKTSQNIGIGISGIPSDKLHVSGAMRLEGAFKDSNNEAGTAGQLLSSTVTGTDWIDPKLPVVENKTANYALVAADNGKVFTFNSTADVTLTVPTGLPVGYNVSIYQTNTGKVIISGGATILNRLSRFKTAGKDAGVGLVATAADIFHLTGDLKK